MVIQICLEGSSLNNPTNGLQAVSVLLLQQTRRDTLNFHLHNSIKPKRQHFMLLYLVCVYLGGRTRPRKTKSERMINDNIIQSNEL